MMKVNFSVYHKLGKIDVQLFNRVVLNQDLMNEEKKRLDEEKKIRMMPVSTRTI